MSHLRSRVVATAALAAATTVLTLTGGAAPASAARVDDFTVVAHRGAPGMRPNLQHTENTMEALNAARRLGVPAVEIDVRTSGDGQLIVMHDDTLTRTTTCTGRVSARTLTDVLSNCRGRVNGERLPTLEKVLAWAGRNQLNVVIDLKRDPAWTPELFGRLEQLLVDAGISDRVVFMSFNADVLQVAKQVNPNRPTDWILDGPWPGAAALAATADVINIDHKLLTRKRVSALHRRGVRVFGRNVNTVDGWAKLRRVGADGVLTDNVRGYLRWSRR